jgi:hypothetical protein
MAQTKLTFVAVTVGVLVVGSIGLWAAVEHDDGEEVDVPLSEVPAEVMEAANESVPGGEVTGAEKEVEDGVLLYEIEKIVDGVEYEIEVTADGAVMEIETEEDDDDDDEDEDEVEGVEDDDG